MNTPHPFEEHLSGLADGTLDGPLVEEVRRHLASCPSCVELVSDLARMRDTARSLGPVAPPPMLRAAVAARLRSHRLLAPAPPPLSSRRWVPWVAAAAMLLAAISAIVAVSSRAGDEPMVAGNEDHLDAITMELELAIEHYERAIEQLQFVAASAGKPLDTDVAAAIETGLATLDQAIAESRRALRADPSSAAARLSLLDALRQKVHVLELTARALDRPQVSRQPLLRVSAGRLT